MNCKIVFTIYDFTLFSAPVLLDDKSQTVDIEVMEVTSAATVEVSEHQDDTFEEQRMLQEEIKEEELEDAWSNNDPGGKRLLLKVTNQFKLHRLRLECAVSSRMN